MKLGIIESYSLESFEKVSKQGLSFIELCMNIGSDVDALEADIPGVLERIEKFGIKIGSIGRWGGQRILEDGSVNESELKIAYQLIDICVKVGCPVYVTGCNFIDDYSFAKNCDFATEFFRLICEYAESQGIKVAAYNCRWDNFVCNDAAWRVILERLPSLGIKFDPSHSIYDGEDYLSVMKKWAHRFYHVHLKGSVIIDGERFDDPPIGMDQTNWGAFMAVLYNKGYNAGLSLEPHSQTWFGDMMDKGVTFSVNYIRPFLLGDN